MKTFAGWTALTLLCAAPSFAEDKKVSVSAEVVEVSTKGNEVIPPSLQHMKDEFQKNEQSRKYTSFKRLMEKRLELRQGKSEQLQLTPKHSANVRLDEISKQDTAKITVEVPSLVTTQLTLGKKGAVFMQVGKADVDPLMFVVLTPVK